MQIAFPARHISKNIFRRVYHFPGQPVTYIQNPKVACTSLILMLWRSYDPAGAPAMPHGPDVKRPFARTLREFERSKIPELMNSQFFSVVRNPYHRFLSAYLDKVGNRENSNAWNRIKKSLGFGEFAPPPPLEYLLDTMLDLDPFEIDHHFRPQYINLMHGFLPLDYLGNLEDLTGLNSFLAQQGLVLTKEDSHATNSANKVKDRLSASAATKLVKFYERDFEFYGYGENIDQRPQIIVPKVSNDRAALRKFLEENVRT